MGERSGRPERSVHVFPTVLYVLTPFDPGWSAGRRWDPSASGMLGQRAEEQRLPARHVMEEEIWPLSPLGLS